MTCHNFGNVRFRLVDAGRLQHDKVRDAYLLLLPERVVKLNRTAYTLLSFCDGSRTVEQVIESLNSEYGVDFDGGNEALEFFEDALSKGWIEDARDCVSGGSWHPSPKDAVKVSTSEVSEPNAADSPMASYRSIQPPYGLIAELTHRCPLQCLYCSNPIDLKRRALELSTEEWKDVIKQARALGVVEIHLSGGEPLIRPDIVELVRSCSDVGIYSNLITSGIGLTEPLLAELRQAGLCSVQLSFQSDDEATSRKIAGVDLLQYKQVSAQLLSASQIPLTINVVLSALNIERLDSILKLCTAYGAGKIEIANCQYYGWALQNRSALLPTRSQLDQAQLLVDRWRKQIEVEIVWVAPDYFEDYPKPCSGGWAQRQLTVSPDGTALPCAAARQITGIDYPDVREFRLSWIWNESEAFNRYRGYSWMKEPCLTCERKEIDFGGCRCQAFLLTGDATEADPVCIKSTNRLRVDVLADGPDELSTTLSYRRSP